MVQMVKIPEEPLGNNSPLLILLHDATPYILFLITK